MRTLQLLVSGPEATPTIRLIDIAPPGVEPVEPAELAASNPTAADRPALDSAGMRARFGDPLRLQADLMKDGQRLFDWLTHGPIAAAWQTARLEGAHTLLDI